MGNLRKLNQRARNRTQSSVFAPEERDVDNAPAGLNSCAPQECHPSSALKVTILALCVFRHLSVPVIDVLRTPTERKSGGLPSINVALHRAGGSHVDANKSFTLHALGRTAKHAALA